MIAELEEVVRRLALSLGILTEGIAAVVIAHALALAIFNYLRGSVSVRINKTELRLRLGSSLAIALEFLLAADILRTAVSPGWDEIGKLIAIAAIRTLLNYFLENEIQKTETKHPV